MAYDYSNLLAQAQQWAEAAIAEGQISHAQAQDLLVLDTRSTDRLFVPDLADGAKPLIVAFMGGTGVGKSSLLNRLAGQAIAKAGVERPTSREVTLYHHQSLTLKQLPAGLPLDKIKISQHNDASKSALVWIDMPDFDSIEQSNKQLVLEWLPHIDVLLYVVSPERYRDNKAWQMLLAEGEKHAWLFVMNQWDRGLPQQFEDLKRQLALAGFDNPLLFRTSCTEPEQDEFNALLSQLQQLAGSHQLEQLAQRNHEIRRQQLQTALQKLANLLKQRDYPKLQQQYQIAWQTTEQGLKQGLAWPLQQMAQSLIESVTINQEHSVWDGWAQSQLEDLLDNLSLQANQLNIAVKPLKAALNNLKPQAEKTVRYYTELSARQALLKPGNGLQRFLLGLTAICETVLPLTAMAVVGYQVFSGYYQSTIDTKAYLGSEFAIHSGLLIALSWLIPFFLNKKLQPSQQKAALNGLKRGLEHALLTIDNDIQQNLNQQQQRHNELLGQIQNLIQANQSVTTVSIEKASDLARMLVGSQNPSHE
ncbi:MAG: GTPase [Methylomonas sp.]